MNNKRWDALWMNASVATMPGEGSGYGLIQHAALATKDEKIVWLGEVSALPSEPNELAQDVFDLKNKCITPTLIDCHTHLVYAGNRYHEFEMRMQGKTYADIAKAGGGIQSTVNATRIATEEELFNESLPRAKAIASEGVTLIEIKSGYGLDLANELKMLRVAKKIGETLKIKIILTFLGAHALPKEYAGKADEYIDLVCNEMLPAVKSESLAECVDVFCESIGFSLAQTEKVFEAATQLGLKIKCHAEQLSNLGASQLAAKYKALSVDHLEFLTEKDIAALAESQTIAVLLPGAFYFLREKKLPPIALLRQYNIPMAIATDCNPGTSPFTSLTLMANMACVLLGLTPEEAFKGITLNAGKALGFPRHALEIGSPANFCIWNVSHPVDLIYSPGLYKPLIIYKGKTCITANSN